MHLINSQGVFLQSCCLRNSVQTQASKSEVSLGDRITLARNTALLVNRTKSNPSPNYGLFKNNNNDLPIVIY